MCIKINREMFEVNKDIVPDSLIFMLHAYHSGNYEKFAFWYRQFEKSIKVEEKCECREVVINI